MDDKNPKSSSPWSPLKIAVFRSLWIATIFSNIGIWIHDVGAGWLMTSLAPSPLMVSLVQTAGTLPMFLLALPAGALADIIDKRKLLIVAQFWMLTVALSLGAITYYEIGTAGSLLLLTFLLNLGAAMSMPAWQSITPLLVPRSDLPQALALNSMGINISRTIGPALGGYIISLFGPYMAFVLNAASFSFVIVILYRWKQTTKENNLPAESLFNAIRLGLRFTRHSTELRSVIIRTAAFIIPASALWALLPLATKKLLGGGSSDYGILLTCIGAGAVMGAILLPRLKTKFGVDSLVAAGILLLASGFIVLGFVPVFGWVCVALFVGGMAWLTLLSSLNVAAQTSVPSWVRARAMAIYFMLVFFGGMAVGSLMWGTLASIVGIPMALLVAAVGLVIGLSATYRHRLAGREELNLAPSMHWPAPAVNLEPDYDDGPVLVTIEHIIDPVHSEQFVEAMEGVRKGRLRDGAIHWGLFQDLENPKRYVENFIVESWAEHLRQHERVTKEDQIAQETARNFYVESTPPKVAHLIYRALKK
jgi:MFS family permease